MLNHYQTVVARKPKPLLYSTYTVWYMHWSIYQCINMYLVKAAHVLISIPEPVHYVIFICIGFPLIVKWPHATILMRCAFWGSDECVPFAPCIFYPPLICSSSCQRVNFLYQHFPIFKTLPLLIVLHHNWLKCHHKVKLKAWCKAEVEPCPPSDWPK